MIQVNRIYLIFNRLVTKKFFVDTSVFVMQSAAQLLFAQNLTIEVCDIEKVEGHLYVAIYNSEETFLSLIHI